MASQAFPSLKLDTLLAEDAPIAHVRAGKRAHGQLQGCQWVKDELTHGTCTFLRFHQTAHLALQGHFTLTQCAAGGWLLRSLDIGLPSHWLPMPAVLRQISPQGHILQEREADLSSLEIDSDGVAVACSDIPAGWVLDAVVWQLTDPSLAEELHGLAPIETQDYFLLGSHTRHARPADLYQHLIHGRIYERNYAWPHKRKICSENDAHALYMLYSGLEKATKKAIYGLFKRQLLLGVLSRQGEDGAFRHGEWTDHMEAHYRLNASALHLMLDSLAEAPNAVVKAAAGKLADFLATKTDQLNTGTWFLHDDLEMSEATMSTAPFRWVRSRALGKRPSNMLVLNTQLDTLIGLRRHGELANDRGHTDLLASADRATQAVLNLDGSDWLYRPVMWLICLTLLPTPRAQALPLYQRIAKRLASKYLLPRMPDIKSRFPRLVMPGGYIDRELSLRTWAHHYLSINLMDLARYRRSSNNPTLDPVIHACAQFAAQSGILERWAELRYEKYALGFWAEALYHLCRIFPQHEDYRKRMIEAVLLLEATGQGMPPSLLGGNAEAVAPADQFACPIPADTRLRVVNLGDLATPELLIVNPTATAVPLTWHTPPQAQIYWPADIVPPRGGLLGRTR